MTTVLETMESDRDLFLDPDENPEAKSAVYTPLGGIAQPAVTVLFIHNPLHGDENQDEDVEQPYIRASAKSGDLPIFSFILSLPSTSNFLSLSASFCLICSNSSMIMCLYFSGTPL